MEYVRKQWSGKRGENRGKSEGREMRSLEYYISRYRGSTIPPGPLVTVNHDKQIKAIDGGD